MLKYPKNGWIPIAALVFFNGVFLFLTYFFLLNEGLLSGDKAQSYISWLTLFVNVIGFSFAGFAIVIGIRQLVDNRIIFSKSQIKELTYRKSVFSEFGNQLNIIGNCIYGVISRYERGGLNFRELLREERIRYKNAVVAMRKLIEENHELLNSLFVDAQDKAIIVSTLFEYEEIFLKAEVLEFNSYRLYVADSIDNMRILHSRLSEMRTSSWFLASDIKRKIAEINQDVDSVMR